MSGVTGSTVRVRPEGVMTSAVVAFDAHGTLFDVSSAISVHREAIGEDADAFAALWRSKQLEYTWTLTLMDRYENLWSLTQHAFDFCSERFPLVDRSLREQLLEAYRVSVAYDDVAPTLERLRGRAVRVVVFTNGSIDMVTEALQAAKIGHLLDDVVSLEPVKTYKTPSPAYAYLCDRLVVEPAEAALVSSNRWDVAGATAFGLKAIWCNRTNQPDEYRDLSPISVVRTLTDI